MPIDGQWLDPGYGRCRRKIRYPNWNIAEQRAQEASIKTGELIIAYHCYDCDRFHIGHADLAQHLVRPPEMYEVLPETHPNQLPRSCPQCHGMIPDERRKAAELSNSPTVYCSRLCKRRAGDCRTHREADPGNCD